MWPNRERPGISPYQCVIPINECCSLPRMPILPYFLSTKQYPESVKHPPCMPNAKRSILPILTPTTYLRVDGLLSVVGSAEALMRAVARALVVCLPLWRTPPNLVFDLVDEVLQETRASLCRQERSASVSVLQGLSNVLSTFVPPISSIDLPSLMRRTPLWTLCTARWKVGELRSCTIAVR